MTMKPSRRQFMQMAIGAAAVPSSWRVARAESYPSRPVRIVVGLPPGGQIDIVARVLGQSLSERLGQTFLIENRPGASGSVAAEVVARAPADGYTLLMCTMAHAVNATLQENVNFHLVRDIAPVAAINRIPCVLEVHPSSPIKTIPDLIAYAAANPGKINIATPAIGTGAYMAAVLFKMMSRIDALIIPYRGDGRMITDLLGGQVQVVCDGISASIGQIRTGELRAIGITTAERLKTLPEIPTVAEFVPGYEAIGWQGIGAPKNTQAGIINKLNNEINAALVDPKIKARLADLGVVQMPMTPAEFGKWVADETEKWAKVILAANIKSE
jgi:tripartite-type tricarboxylate transporter receptor subunit TctC